MVSGSVMACSRLARGMNELRRGRPPRTARPFSPALASTPALAGLWPGTCPGRVRGARPGRGRGAAVQGWRRWNAVLPFTVPVRRGRFAGVAEAAASAGLPARMRDGTGVFDETNADGAARGLDAAGGRRPFSVTTGGSPFARSLEPVTVRGLTSKTVGNGDGGVAPRFGIHALGQGLDECLTGLVDGLPVGSSPACSMAFSSASSKVSTDQALPTNADTPDGLPDLARDAAVSSRVSRYRAVAIIGFAGASPRASRTRRPRCLGGRVAPVLLR